MVTLLQDFTKSMWRHRCDMVHEQDLKTVDARTRDKAKDLCRALRTSFFLLLENDRHLAQRTNRFFDTTPMVNIHTWMTRINLAINKNEETKKRKKFDIRTWLKPEKNRMMSERKNKKGRNSNEALVHKKTGKNMQLGTGQGTLDAYFCT